MLRFLKNKISYLPDQSLKLTPGIYTQTRCKTAAESFKEPSKAAQRFCIPLQLEWSCCLASKRLLNSCNLAVQLFWSDFVALYSTVSFVRKILLTDLHTFPSRISWEENLIKDQSISLFGIILLTLTTFTCDCVYLLLGENGCWSLLGFKGLILPHNCHIAM